MNYQISVDLAPALQALQIAGNEIALRVSEVVAATAQSCYERWVDEVMKADGVYVGEKQDYAQSIKVRSINSFSAEVWSDYKHAVEIENGRPARDLKKMLNTSLKVRINAKGARYLIIPFRHNTPGYNAHATAMPADIYDKAKEMQQSSIIGQGVRLSGTGAYDPKTKQQYLVPTRIYKWGDRLPAGLSPKLKESHATDIYAGMVRMKESTGGSAYLTFRTMKEGSPKWITSPKPGLFIVQNLVNDMQPLFAQAMEKAIGGILPANL